jgi:16S rRNA (cytosine1402-N4)-methyltransferase
MEFIHTSVLLKEVTENLIKNENGTYWDVTCGGGGHSYALLKNYPKINLICSDWDLNALKATEEKLEEFSDRVEIIYGNMGNLKALVNRHNIKKVDGFLADFGTSRNQIMHEEGFSFMVDSYLDMRMSKGMHQKKAADILNWASEKELANIFYEYGQEKHSRILAKKIVEEREKKKFKTTLQFANFVEKIIPRAGKIHPATRVFQALRIAVNDELKEIKSFLHHVSDFLNSGGRLACISFHSLEDTLVKSFLKENKDKFFDHANGIIIPKAEEIKINSASRSSKLRVFEKI